MIKAASWLIPFISLLVAYPVSAVPKRPNALVIVVEGDAEAEREIADAILPKLPTQPPDDLVAALADYGIQGSPSRALVAPQTRQQALLAFRKAMKQVGAAAVLTVQFRRSKAGGREMHVILLLSTQIEPMIEEDITVPKGDKVTPQLAPLLSVSLQDLVPPPPDASDARSAAATPVSIGAPARNARKADNRPSGENADKRVRKKSAEKSEVMENDASPALPEKDSGSQKREEHRYSDAMVVADAGVGIASRKLEYSDAVAGPLRNHAVSAMAVYTAGLEVYPAARSGLAVVKNIGLVGQFVNSFEVESKTRDGAQAARGSLGRYALGVRGRIPTGDTNEGVLIGLQGTYGVWAFAFSGRDPFVNDALTAEYKYLRAAADARVPLGAFTFLGGAGYMSVSSAGPFNERFPRASIQGVDAMLGGAYALTSQVGIRAQVTYARIFSTAHPELDAPYVAGGALDQYVVMDLGVSAIF